ncbi:uncharacterized protein BDW70DRAFT_12836 [Aspergillus foveolatus]|uniref:uncharacterized protein n=1 Tax=Aspergillus foveolatus TaxID=210207 RepID=UPI003CCD8D34
MLPKSKYGMRPWSIWFSALQSYTPDRRVYYEPRLLKLTFGIEIDDGVYDAAIERDHCPIESRFIIGLEVRWLVFSFIIWPSLCFHLGSPTYYWVSKSACIFRKRDSELYSTLSLLVGLHKTRK